MDDKTRQGLVGLLRRRSPKRGDDKISANWQLTTQTPTEIEIPIIPADDSEGDPKRDQEVAW